MKADCDGQSSCAVGKEEFQNAEPKEQRKKRSRKRKTKIKSQPEEIV